MLKSMSIVLLVSIVYYWFVKIGPVYKSDKSLIGKTVVITGGNAGIGKYTAIEVAKRKANVIIASRNVKKSEQAKREIVEMTGNENIQVLQLDLEDFDSVREFAEILNSSENDIDYLVNNAGVLWLEGMTKHGYNRVFTVNHLGHFLLTNLLMEKFETSGKPVRIINVSSGAYKLGQLDWENLHNDPKGFVDIFKAYSNSKLANVYFTSELHKRFSSKGITSYAIHPGAIVSEIGDNWPFAWMWKYLVMLFARDTFYGPQTIMYTLLDDKVVDLSGKYFAECAMEELLPHAANQTLGEELWERSLQMVELQ